MMHIEISALKFKSVDVRPSTAGADTTSIARIPVIFFIVNLIDASNEIRKEFRFLVECLKDRL